MSSSTTVASAASIVCATGTLQVESPSVVYTPETISSVYSYDKTEVTVEGGVIRAVPVKETLNFVTDRVVRALCKMVSLVISPSQFPSRSRSCPAGLCCER